MSPVYDPMVLRQIAGASLLARADAYVADGAVEITGADAASIRALVQGRDVYAVALQSGGTQHASSFNGTCTCAARRNAAVCRHMIATALAVNALSDFELTAFTEEAAALAHHVAGLPHTALVALVLDATQKDVSLRRTLSLAAAARGTDAAKVLSSLRRALHSATDLARFDSGNEGKHWIAGIREVLQSFAVLLEHGHADIAIQLAHEAIVILGNALVHIDDYDGDVAGMMQNAMRLHAAAAVQVAPDAAGFARQLLDMALRDELFALADILPVYGDALGGSGIAELESLSLAHLDALPLAVPTQRQPGGHSYHPIRGQLLRLLDHCAARRGDVDARIALLQRDLTSAARYIDIVQLLRTAGRESDALQWARDGLFAHESNPDEELVVSAVSLLDATGKPDEATVLLTKTFVRCPSLEIYFMLAERKSGVEREAVADWAVDLLETGAAGRSQPNRFAPLRNAMLVTILTREGRYEHAWIAVVRDKIPVMAPFVEELARQSGAQFPREASFVWRTHAAHKASLGGNANYDAAFALVRRLEHLAKDSNTLDEHAGWLEGLLQQHKSKRHFIRMFARQAPISALRRAT